MNILTAVSSAAIITAICTTLLKNTNKEITLLLPIAAVIVLGGVLFPQIKTLLEQLKAIDLPESAENSIAVLVRSLGIALTARFSSNLCKDAGESALAFCVDFAAQLAVVLLSLPLLQELLGIFREVLLP